MYDKYLNKNELIQRFLSFIEIGLLAAVIITLLLKLHLIFLLNINQDEFNFLSTVYKYMQGSLSNPFFTFHVHFFPWVTYISKNEVTQVIAARVLMYLFNWGSCIFIYLIGRIFLNISGALFSVLCYLSISNVIVHSSSFRYDPICVFLFLISIYLLLKNPLSIIASIIQGFLMAVAFMVSLKTAFYVPTIFFIHFSIQDNKRDIFKRLIVFSTALIVSFFLLYYFHRQSLLSDHAHSTGQVINYFARGGIIFDRLFPTIGYFFITLIENIFIWIIWLLGLIIIVYRLIYNKNRTTQKNFLLLPLLIPLLSLIFYRFGFPYFYAFIIPPAIIYSGVLIDKLAKDYKNNGSRVILVSIFCIFFIVILNFFSNYKIHAFDQTVSQREIVGVVHKLFPNPVPYIDRCSMISSFPKVGLHMTTWDMENYKNSNKPIMRKLLLRQSPVFVLANIAFLDLSYHQERRDIFKNYPLLEEDYNTLNQNFIHHWGKLYVAGKHFYFDSKTITQIFDILIPGIYTLEADGKVMINGIAYEPDSKIRFEKMTYTIKPEEIPMTVTLRWGNDLYKPSFKPSKQPIFLGYYLQALKMRPN